MIFFLLQMELLLSQLSQFAGVPCAIIRGSCLNGRDNRRSLDPTAIQRYHMARVITCYQLE